MSSPKTHTRSGITFHEDTGRGGKMTFKGKELPYLHESFEKFSAWTGHDITDYCECSPASSVMVVTQRTEKFTSFDEHLSNVGVNVLEEGWWKPYPCKGRPGPSNRSCRKKQYIVMGKTDDQRWPHDGQIIDCILAGYH